MTLSEEYIERHDKALIFAATCLEDHLKQLMDAAPRIDRISARAKATDRFLVKADAVAEGGSKKYSDPINQIQDQIGARIVVFYLSDVTAVSARVEKYFKKIEVKAIVPDSEAEFGYFGKHYILKLPSDVIAKVSEQALLPEFFELQVKTLFQHAWSEAEHDLAYKPSYQLTSDQKRKVAFTAAQAWGADMIFDELHQAGQSRLGLTKSPDQR